ncbi:MAG TPA: hypothetical protein VK933_15690 [Longimicrobiales bacterium]|nr:hypothetical protein [Longimicrobiales bacterium]
MKTRVWIPIAALMAAAPVQAAVVDAQAGDWAAWYGCWRAVDSTDGKAPLVCVLPGADASAVRIATIEDGQIAEETVVRADGVARDIAEGGCTGSESAFFSADGRRIFTRAELACSGLGRLSTGVLAMVSETEWVDAQALTVNGQHAARTIRYRAADPTEIPSWISAELPRDQQLAQETARLDAASPLEIDAVIEASRHVAAPVVEALLAERQHGFGLNAARLTRLQEAGVPASTIDVMVALSYPTRFAVAPQRGMRSDNAEYPEQNAARSYMEDCYDPFFTSSRYGCYNSRYGYGYSRGRGIYGYSPYGYDPYGWNYGTRPVVVIVQPGDGEVADPQGGAVVKGRGYTRTGTARGTANPRGADRSVPAPASATSSKPATTTTKPSSTSSGSTSKPTRTAKPRGGGGN